MTTALPRPSLATLATQWSVQPLAVAAAVALTAWYWRSARRVPGRPARRSIGFAAGIAVFVWTTCGFPQAYGRTLFWVWTVQSLALWLLVPLLLLSGGVLVRARTGIAGTLRSRLASPVLGPALLPVLAAVLFLGPVAGWAVATPWVGYPLHLVLVAAGIVMLRPFVDAHSGASSLAVGLALAIGMVEFALTTVPGIVLRLSGSLVTGYFDHRRVPAWAWYPLHDQHLAGTILWAVPALGALPFVVLAQRRWAQADAQEAAEVDTVLEAERIAQGEPDRDAPWWLSDPTLRDRFGR